MAAHPSSLPASAASTDTSATSATAPEAVTRSRAGSTGAVPAKVRPPGGTPAGPDGGPARIAGGAGAGPGSRAGEAGRRHAAARWEERWYLREVVLAWLAARFIVAAALGLTKFISDTVAGEQGAVLSRTDLLGWDAGWYKTIAEVGYSGAGAESRRFFPLLPLLVRGLSKLPGAGDHVGLVLVVLVNLLALVFALLLVRIAQLEGFTPDAITRVVWLAALAPPAFVLVMGYAEALAGLLAVAAFLGARTRRWELAAVAGLLGGLCRPLGLILLVPVLIEAARGLPLPLARRLGPAAAPPASSPLSARRAGARRMGASSARTSGHDAPPTEAAAGSATAAATASAAGSAVPAVVPVTARELLRRLVAVLGPVAGAGAYVLWSARSYGDGLAPFTLQRDEARHGSTSNPVAVLWDATRGAFHDELGTALHVPWLLLALVGLVVMARRLPVSYAVWSALVLAAVLTGSNLDSAERYVYGAFPFLLVAALVTARREVFTFVLAGTAAAMTVYATLAFTLSYVP